MDSVCGVWGGTAVPDREGYCDVCANTWAFCQQLLDQRLEEEAQR